MNPAASTINCVAGAFGVPTGHDESVAFWACVFALGMWGDEPNMVNVYIMYYHAWLCISLMVVVISHFKGVSYCNH